MANTDIHEKQARSNYNLLKNILLETIYTDWQIVLAYYTAIHIFECQLTLSKPNWRAEKLSDTSLNSESPHIWRKHCVDAQFHDVSRYYRMLEQRSRTARYLEGTAGDKIACNIITKEDAEKCINDYLKKILERFNYNW